MTSVQMQRHSKRKKEALVFWRKVVSLYNPPSSLSAAEIAEMFTNPKTGKKYTPAGIWYILQQVREQKVDLAESE